MNCRDRGEDQSGLAMSVIRARYKESIYRRIHFPHSVELGKSSCEVCTVASQGVLVIAKPGDDCIAWELMDLRTGTCLQKNHGKRRISAVLRDHNPP